MIDISGSIFVCTAYVDMRKSIDGLSQLVSVFTSAASVDSIKITPVAIDMNTSVFVFINRTKDKIKILLKESNGFCLVYKRLDRGCFKINFTAKGPVRVTNQQLRWLLDGLDYAVLKPLKSPVYSVIF
jgi:transposase